MIIVYTPEAQKQLSKLDKKAAGQIKSYMERIAALEDPRDKGKALKGNLGEYWRYRTGDYRIICKIVPAEKVSFLQALSKIHNHGN